MQDNAVFVCSLFECCRCPVRNYRSHDVAAAAAAAAKAKAAAAAAG